MRNIGENKQVCDLGWTTEARQKEEVKARPAAPDMQL